MTLKVIKMMVDVDFFDYFMDTVWKIRLESTHTIMNMIAIFLEGLSN